MLGLLLVLVGISFVFNAIGQLHVMALMGAKEAYGGAIIWFGYLLMLAGLIVEGVKQYG